MPQPVGGRNTEPEPNHDNTVLKPAACTFSGGTLEVHKNVLHCNLPFANVLIALYFRVLYRFLV